MPALSNCCCYYGLKTGALAIGYIESLVSFLLIIAGIVISVLSDVIAKEISLAAKRSAERVNLTNYNSITEHAVYNTSVMITVLTVVWLLAAVALMIGTIERNHNLILPYLVVKVVHVCYTVYALITNQAHYIVINEPFLIYLAISAYLWLCILSHFQEIREKSNSPVIKIFCFCSNLHVGGIVIGFIATFLSIILLITGFVLAATSDTVIDAINKHYKTASYVHPPYQIDLAQFNMQIIVNMILTAVLLAASIALIIGTVMSYYDLIIPFLVIQVVYTIYIFYFMVMFETLCEYVTYIQFLIFLGVDIYAWICVFSLCEDLQESGRGHRAA